MEVEIQREYNPAHPNFERWQSARELSKDRAKFVESILLNEINLQDLKILDMGAGEGSTSELLSKNNFVVSLEPKPERIKKISGSDSLSPLIAESSNLPVKTNSFDLIILQDVIEHLNINKKFIEELTSLLKNNGRIYLSTPNRFSFINIISDPHWGIPFLCLFKRDLIKKYFLKYFRKNDFQRDDIAELLSLNMIYTLFSQKYSIKIFTKFAVEYLLGGGKGLVWSNFHLWLLRMIGFLGLKKILILIANDEPGIVNKFFTPTFYIILRKKSF